MKRIFSLSQILSISLLALTLGITGLETPGTPNVSYSSKVLEDTVAKLKKHEATAQKFLHPNAHKHIQKIRDLVSQLKSKIDELKVMNNQLSDKQRDALTTEISNLEKKIDDETNSFSKR